MALSTVGSGLDITSLVSQLVAAERKPAETRINTAGTAATAKLSALSTIKSSLSTLQTSIKALTSSAATATYKATVADGAAFSAIATTSATAGRYDVEVLSIATPQKLVSDAIATGSAPGHGTLSFAWGEDQSLDVEIEEGATAADIAAAVNRAAAGKGVTASVVTANDGDHLVFNAVDNGQSGVLTITTSGGDGGLAALTWDPDTATGGMTERLAATDAQVKIDGFLRTSSSNTLTDAIPGVAITLTKAMEGTSSRLTVAQDNTPLKTNLQAFVASYNATVTQLKSSSSYDSNTKTASALTGDSLVRGMQTQLRNLVSGSVNELKELGVKISTDGSLTFDSGTFDTAIATNPTAADKLFGNSGSFSTQLNTFLTGQLDSTNGTLSLRTESLNKQITKLEKELDDLDVRMIKLSTLYTRQFTAMDTLVTKMQSTSDYLTQQLESLKAQTS